MSLLDRRRIRDLESPGRDLQGRILDLSVPTDVRPGPPDREDLEMERWLKSIDRIRVM